MARALVGLVLLILSDGVVRAEADAAESWFQLRYRYEHVEQAGFVNDARASTMRARFGARSAERSGFSLLGEADAVLEAGVADYNDGVTMNAVRRTYPVIADPKGTDLNQGFLQYRAGTFAARLGRQKIQYDNQRFIGSAAWRQHEQTFDAVSLALGSGASWSLQYAYVAQVKRVLGQSNAGGRHDHDSHFLNVGLDIGAWGALTGYAYLVDNEDAPVQSTRTVGMRWGGSKPVGSNVLSWSLEAARQFEYGNNPVDFQAEYIGIEGEWDCGIASFTAGFERLGGDADRSGAAFRTPLAALHKFNGWADAFVVTPDEGLDDAYLSVRSTYGATTMTATLHRFDAQSGGRRLGNEIDLAVTYGFTNAIRGLVKYAHYDGGATGRADRDKLWFMVTTDFP